LAIVHELSADPTCRTEWIDQALRTAFVEADRAKARTIALPLLGTVHGRIPESTSFALFKAAIAASPKTHLERIWLVIPADRLDVVASLL
jgi:O-acetyl-ADP-ribose deacetylase (regulator of RNase III)